MVHLGRHLKGREGRALVRALFPGGTTRDRAETLQQADLLDRAPGVLRLVKVALDDAQFDALMSFVFNAGAGHLAAATLLRLLNAGNDDGAADQFLVWNRGRKDGVLVELPGLTRRHRSVPRARRPMPSARRRSPPVGAGRPSGHPRRGRASPAEGLAPGSAQRPPTSVRPRARTTTETARPRPAPAPRRGRRTAP
jgi:Phage lysozyme